LLVAWNRWISLRLLHRVDLSSGPLFVAEITHVHMNSGSIEEKFALITEHWRPKVLAQANGMDLRAVKVQGVFPWHVHQAQDELFLVWRGELTIEFRDKRVVLKPGDFFVVKAGVEHRTLAEKEAEVLIFEPQETINTGNVQDEKFTAPNGIRV
jgi:mannose-6-phosphate isomerase-like protein (cupin superfamily)